MRLILATLALGLSMAVSTVTTSAHPNYPGLTSRSPAAGKAIAHKAADAVATAKRYVGTNPTTMRRLWCANFIGMIEKKHGRAGTGSNLARSYLDYGKAVAKRQARRGDIVVLKRGKSRRSGHVGYFVEWLPDGRAVLVSGNAGGGIVRVSAYEPGRIIGIRRPA